MPLLAAVGALSMQRLGLNVLIYDPMVHYQRQSGGLPNRPNPPSQAAVRTAVNIAKLPDLLDCKDLLGFKSLFGC